MYGTHALTIDLVNYFTFVRKVGFNKVIVLEVHELSCEVAMGRFQMLKVGLRII